MKHLSFIIGTLLILGITATSPVIAQCNTASKLSFKAGEKVLYDVYYNLSLIWVHAGEVSFEVESTRYKNQNAYLLKSYGRSLSKYDWVYTVRDTFETYVDAGNHAPLAFRRKTREGSYRVNNSYKYIPENSTVYTWVENSDAKEIVTDTVALPDCTFDVLSAIYYCRNLDFSKYKPGDKIPMKLLLDGKVYDELYVRYLGKEVIEDREDRKWHTIKFKPLLVEGTIFSGGEEMTVWVTDDANKVPVKIEAEVLVGKVKAFIREAENLRLPLENSLNQ
ncbi:DUF3108 domain-containing protein [Roseivirga sp. BDSF3-8]|uniref:DUF3108 domain-containing protein n=1 Tax=Roseivirga sp. BDSF3-8 TaxID=3241598 RepID=UPI003531EC37